MITVTSLEDFSAASGIINVGFLENIYHSVIDETFLDLGRTVVLHLKPQIEQDVSTQVQSQSAQYNPFFGRVGVSKTNTRQTGTKVTHRDVQYKAHIKIGPTKEGDDSTGIGNLKANQAAITLAIESLPHLQDTLSVSIEGRRYSVLETRPIGFSRRRYIIAILEEIQETDIATGENEG